MTVEFQPSRRSLILSAVMSSLLVLLCGGMAIYILSDPELKLATAFPRAVRTIQEYYDGDIDWDNAFRSAQEAMFAQLDRYSGYIDKQEFSQMEEELSGSYSGIGVSVIKHDLGLLIMSVREGGPSAAAGLLSGDVIERVDSIDIAPLDVDEASLHLRGPEGSPVRLLVYRPVTNDTMTVTVSRGRVALEHIPFAGYTNDSMIYIRLLDFEAGASSDVESAIDSLLKKPGATPRGLILDLRGNPGGLFEEAIGTANLFLKKDLFIVGTASRSRWEEERFSASGGDITNGLPMAVLVDNGSASSAEIVSGALHQLGRAILVGDTTFGKGLVQGYTRFPDGSGIRLTISRYFLQGNLFLSRLDSTHSDTGNGLIPDYLVSFAERSPFLIELESSLLLQKFAYYMQDSIIAGPPPEGHGPTWTDQFKSFADQQKFRYVSFRTEQAETLLIVAHLLKSDPAVIAQAGQLLKLSQVDDLNQFQENGAYIEMRLRHLAFERRYGSYRAYAEAIVNTRPDIRLAARLLRGGTS